MNADWVKYALNVFGHESLYPKTSNVFRTANLPDNAHCSLPLKSRQLHAASFILEQRDYIVETKFILIGIRCIWVGWLPWTESILVSESEKLAIITRAVASA